MASELCMNCFSVKGQYEVCPFCGYIEGTPPKQPHYLMPGTILGNHFIVGTVIGFGGFGITYKCFDITLGVIVAVKEFYPSGLVNRSPGECQLGLLLGDKKQQYAEQLKRFLMEAQSVAQFGKAKDIVNVYDFFQENNTAYIIMEYIDGVLLKDYLEKQGKMNPDVAMAVITPIITAVKKIHSKGIIHRDISPDNIFIAGEDAVKVFDFGAAQLNDSSEGMAGEKVIKVGYSAPEQYRDKSRQGYFTDVYSVGAILYQMLTGVQPIESTEREFRDELKSPLEFGIKINGNIDRAVMEAMAVKPELRFQGIQQFEDALASKRIAEYPRDKLRKRKRRRMGIVSLAVMLVLAVGVGIGLYSTILKPKNRIFDSSIHKDTITVWVENEDQKTQLDELVEDGFKKGDGSDGVGKSSDKIRTMQEEDAEIKVDVMVQPNMETALQEAKQQNVLPNMFLSDHVSNLQEYKLAILEDNVYAALDLDEYLYLSEYPEYFKTMTEMPTGIDTLLLYACQFGYHKDNALPDSGHNSKDPAQSSLTVELDALITKDGSQDKTKEGYLNAKSAVFLRETKAYTMLLQDPDWSKVLEKEMIPDQEMRNSLEAIQRFYVTADRKKYQINNKSELGLYGSNVVATVSERVSFQEAKTMKEQEKGANPLSDYQTYVVTDQGKMLIILSERYAITRQSSDNQKTACMRLLWAMLSEKGQEKKNGQSRTVYPIRRDSLKEFYKYNAGFGGLENLVLENHDCVVIGRETGMVGNFMQGLEAISDAEAVQEYCEQYTSGSP
ncbi:MAG: serine/threonine protein kinase [Lachnospiraceae bacterium]|nr:serine/threonine protein kinase [Lachnospiraceae bacterium]